MMQIKGKADTDTHYLWTADNWWKYDDRIKVVSKIL